MKRNQNLSPDYLFEVSWEVCNKVGGIHTVIATKALHMSRDMENRHILIGPDVWRETKQNPEFLEDPRLLLSWRDRAMQEGLRIRVGRWNVPGNPIAVLVDFSSYIARKDEIFTDLWKKFGLDSISGQWDYIESALFGYATGIVIESFVRHNLAPHHKSVAQFHEWMTGTGLLYLKSIKIPVATTFTTHATVLGRSIAGNMLPLYDNLEMYNPVEKARDLNVVAKHSLEKTAAFYADALTTVSDITARECAHFLEKKVDIVTPNGFENSITPPDREFDKKRQEGRDALLEIASRMLHREVDTNAFLVGISGRYEFKNKGIDVFLESMAILNRERTHVDRQILAFIMVPANHKGPRKDYDDLLTSHYLHDPEYDPVLNVMREQGLTNAEKNNVKVFFIPCYLNGDDGLINKTYYELLIGLDLSVFPSYYEPWGYTPLESLAFRVPTITTSLAGFGAWVEKIYKSPHPGIEIIFRGDNNYVSVVNDVTSVIRRMSALSPAEAARVRDNARDVSTIALWDNQLQYYKKAYSIALDKIIENLGRFPLKREECTTTVHRELLRSFPTWSPVTIQKQLPQRLNFLEVLSRNLWWSWNQDARKLFSGINPELWEQVEKNPILLLDKIPYKQYKILEKNKAFLERLDRVETHFNAYMKARESLSGPAIAYFSMEYGLDWSLKIYSGGLGILAGDYLKESSDKGVSITGIGLLYRYGYFRQFLSAQGDQVSDREAVDFQKIPVIPVRDENDNWTIISIAFPGRNVYARIWKVDVGRTPLYLLDTDFEDNLPEDRSITHQLYGGDWENRLKQELLLGVGGIRALRALGIDADVYHCNEGHAAFIGLERIREYVVDENLSFEEAREVVRASSLFTTHTPVPAGHDAFTEDMLRPYFSHYPDRLKISWDTLMALGKTEMCDPHEKFSMSYLASNLSQEINGVSKMHGQVSREILNPLWPGYLPQESHVDYVTNGVHYQTWTAPEWKEVHSRIFGEDFGTHHYNKDCFMEFLKVGDKEVWSIRNGLRGKLIDRIVTALSSTKDAPEFYSPRDMVAIRGALSKDILTVGFARRFATYKRAHLLFANLDRLDELVNNPQRPVQFLFAGKAHPHDKAGQDLIRRIVEVSRMPRFIGKILFLPNYNMEMAKRLVQGVDVWMNTPTRPLEASGTSGEKAAMNGVMHFSVLDGWWVEGYREGAGWALSEERTYENQAYQDELDAAVIYNMLENEIAPMFYNRNDEGIPVAWVQHIKNTVAYVAGNFTTNRMMEDYEQKFYRPLQQRHVKMAEDNYALAKEMAFWKRRMEREWSSLEVLSYTHPNDSKDILTLGSENESRVKLYLGALSTEDIGVEMVITMRGRDGGIIIDEIVPFTLENVSNGEATYVCRLVPQTAGSYYVASRIFAKNQKMPHRQDFALVKWL
ncbi:MAG: Maltodextrin phosphorylase [Bacteroidetes bacterium ADurb.Bin037]|nr:MAG: Maltodextrin phosphorylase [Bacteroidetes bacterium ADurb.Bin037]HPW77836.1 alpha-glucan family phosphorylase [Bacteroidales bacterium]HQB55663.1 alpha-glucan family phosphorylase [Bacteroidales bacterium]